MTPDTTPTTTATIATDVETAAKTADAAASAAAATGVLTPAEATDVHDAATNVEQATEEALPVVDSLESAFAAVIHLVTKDIPDDPHAKALAAWLKGFRP